MKTKKGGQGMMSTASTHLHVCGHQITRDKFSYSIPGVCTVHLYFGILCSTLSISTKSENGNYWTHHVFLFKLVASMKPVSKNDATIVTLLAITIMICFLFLFMPLIFSPNFHSLNALLTGGYILILTELNYSSTAY